MSTTVLIADDDSAHRMLMRRLLEFEGFAVGEAESGKGCIEYVATNRPEIVLLDIHLPDQQGSEVIKQLREIPDWEGRIIVISGDSSSERSCIKLGANLFVLKPINPDGIVLTIREQLATAS